MDVEWAARQWLDDHKLEIAERVQEFKGMEGARQSLAILLNDVQNKRDAEWKAIVWEVYEQGDVEDGAWLRACDAILKRTSQEDDPYSEVLSYPEMLGRIDKLTQILRRLVDECTGDHLHVYDNSPTVGTLNMARKIIEEGDKGGASEPGPVFGVDV